MKIIIFPVGFLVFVFFAAIFHMNAAPTQKQSANKSLVVSRPDLKKINAATLDPDTTSALNYQNLYKKFDNDVSCLEMTLDEYRYLYLGYMFQEDYDPYRKSKYTAEVEKYRSKPDLKKSDLDSIVKYSTKVLKDNPFDLRQMSFLIGVLRKLKKNNLADMWESRLENLLEAIRSTGTGESLETAMYVIYPEHEFDILNVMGYETDNIDYPKEGYDYFIVHPDGSKKIPKPLPGFYFNVERLQDQYELKHPFEEGMDAESPDYNADDLDYDEDEDEED